MLIIIKLYMWIILHMLIIINNIPVNYHIHVDYHLSPEFVQTEYMYSLVIYKDFCVDVAQGRMNGAPNETRTREVSLI